ncbi:MAG: hypothetical protein CMM52_03770 [Rhodospirillaceae bacterium]|nr:hypothetical protein [Rhodospirillaceae bacterium]|tara:strand:- start:1274 stop:2026 length:753 start_codon:yes stop_codon:yes gene_type:complete
MLHRNTIINVISIWILFSGLSAAHAAGLNGQIFKPKGAGPHPAIILLHACGGLRGPVIDFWPAFWTKQGYVVYSHDTFAAMGVDRCSRRWVVGSADGRRDDALAALGALAARKDVDAKRIAVMGGGMGAITVNVLAARGTTSPKGNSFKAGIAMYGNCIILDRSGTQAEFPVAVFLGDKEPRRYQDSCKAVQDQKNVTLHLLPGVYRAFDNPRHKSARQDHIGLKLLYDPNAVKTVQKLGAAFFEKHLGR